MLRPNDRLAKVMAIHRSALLDGDPPVATVAARMQVSRATASRLIKRARDAGYRLDPKHSPVVAVIARGSTDEHRWQVCGTCLTPWPCVSWRGGD